MRLAQATTVTVMTCWVSIAPQPALAQGCGSLVVNITSPASASTAPGATADVADVEPLNGDAPLSPEQVTLLQGWAAIHEPESERVYSCPAL